MAESLLVPNHCCGAAAAKFTRQALMKNPYKPPSAALGTPHERRGVIIAATSLASSLVFTPVVFLAIGWARGMAFPRFLFAPKFLLAILIFSLISAAIVYPARKWHSLLRVLLCPAIGFGLLLGFIETQYWLSA